MSPGVNQARLLKSKLAFDRDGRKGEASAFSRLLKIDLAARRAEAPVWFTGT